MKLKSEKESNIFRFSAISIALASLALFLLLAFSQSAFAYSCAEMPASQYPGWILRYNGSMKQGDVIEDGVKNVKGMHNLSVELTKILSPGIANVKITKKGSYIQKFSITEGGDDFDVALADIRIKGVKITANEANLTIYTPAQAILNITDINITYKTLDNASLPEEEIEIEVNLKNIGELGAENVEIDELFSPFEIISAEKPGTAKICQNSSFRIKYKLKAPSAKESTTYKIYFVVKYKDFNYELNVAHEKEEKIELEIPVLTPELEVKKSAGAYTLLYSGRVVTVENMIKNKGNISARNLKLVDIIPSDLLLISGSPTAEIHELEPGRERRFAYKLASNDPIMCTGSSKVDYEDEKGNSYSTYSDRADIRFSPFIKITKIISDKLPESEALSYDYPIKTRITMESNFSDLTAQGYAIITADPIMKTYNYDPYYSLCKDFWIGESKKCIDKDEPSIVINKSTMVTVVIENAGNTIARDVSVNESLKNVEIRRGNTSWQGTLYPGEKASYTYVAIPKAEDIDIETQAKYADVDPKSLIVNITGYTPGICTKKLKNISFSTSAKFDSTIPSLAVEQNNEIKAYANSIIDISPVIFNNGSEDLHDIEVSFSIDGLEIAKGQSYALIKKLTKGYEVGKNKCDLSLWNNVNITREVEDREVIYEINNGSLSVYVDGEKISHDENCKDAGLEIKHNISISRLRYPEHTPSEGGSGGVEKEIKFMIRGNPYQVPLKIVTPEVDEEKVIPIKTEVKYRDEYNQLYTKHFTTALVIVPSGRVISIIRLERINLSTTIDYTNETKIGEKGKIKILLKNTGYDDISSYNLTLILPQFVEAETNDSRWHGRVEAEVKKGNETRYVFSGEMKLESNISVGGKEEHELLIRATKGGEYAISYKIDYDSKSIKGELPFKVKAPEIEARAELSEKKVDNVKEVAMNLSFKNTGEAVAKNVLIEALETESVKILSVDGSKSIAELKPGEEVNISIVARVEKTAKVGAIAIRWEDEIGNSYEKKFEGVEVKIEAPKVKAQETKAPATAAPETKAPAVTEMPAPEKKETKIISLVPVGEEKPLSFEIGTKEAIATLALAFVVIVAIIKLLTIKVKVEEEEKS